MENPFIREHRAGHHGQPFAKIKQNHTCTATAGLRTYKINLLGTNRVLPGNLSRAPGQPHSCSRATGPCSRATGSTLIENPFIREHARARRHHGQPLAEIKQNHTCTATDGLRTYKINLLGTNPVLPGNR